MDVCGADEVGCNELIDLQLLEWCATLKDVDLRFDHQETDPKHWGLSVVYEAVNSYSVFSKLELYMWPHR